jgi:hypothetical protein
MDLELGGSILGIELVWVSNTLKNRMYLHRDTPKREETGNRGGMVTFIQLILPSQSS